MTLPIRTLHARTTESDYAATLSAVAETWGSATASSYDASDVAVDMILGSDHAKVTKLTAGRLKS